MRRMILAGVRIFIFLWVIIAPAYCAADPQVISDTGTHAVDANGEADGVSFTADGTLSVTDGTNLNNNDNTYGATNDTGVADQGTINFAGDSLVKGNIGASGADALKLINVNGETGELVTIEGNMNVNALTFADNATVSIHGNTNQIFNITAGTPGSGILYLYGTSNELGIIGSAVAELGKLVLANTGLTAISTFVEGDPYVDTIEFAQDGTLRVVYISSHADIITDTNNTGTLELWAPISPRISVSGTIGDANKYLREVACYMQGANSGVTFNGNIYAGYLTFNDAAHSGPNIFADGVSYNLNSVSGAILTDTPGGGILTLNGSSTINGTVGTSTEPLAAINLNGSSDKTVSLFGNVYADNINFGDDNELQIADGVNITADITNTAAGQGTLTLEGVHTITGDIGSTGTGLKLVTVGNGKVTMNGNILATKVNFAGDNTLEIAADNTITGEVNTDTNLTGTLIFAGTSASGGAIGSVAKALKSLDINSGTFTLGHDVVATNTSANGAATIVLNGSRTITGGIPDSGSFTLAGTSTLDVGVNTLTISGTYHQVAGTTLALEVSGTSSGKVVSDLSALVDPGALLNVSVNGAFIPDGTKYTVIDGAAGGVFVNVPSITSNSSFVTFTGASSSGDLILTALRTNSFANIASNAGNSNAAAAAAALEAAGNDHNATADMLNILDALESSSENKIVASLETFSPPVDNGSIQASYSAVNQTVATIERRLSFVRLASNNNTVKTGISTGNEAKKGIEVWGEGFGNHLHQYNSGGIDGYKATLWGISLGADSETIFHNLRAGFNAGYVNGYINSKNNNNRTVMHSSQTTVYATYDLSALYFDGAFSFALNKYLGERKIRVVDTWRTANSDYYGQQYSGYFSMGYTFNKGKGLEITPLGSMQYMHLHLNKYKETEAGALNLNIATQDYDLAQTGLGVKFDYPLKWSKYEIIPEFRWIWLHDFVGDMQQSTGTTYGGGGAAFDTYGVRPDRNTHDLGGSLLLNTDYGVSLTASYDCQLRKDLLGHSGVLTVKYTF